MIRSAGVITYKIENDKIKVLLCHAGGPYRKNIDEGAWTFSKGEVDKKEKVIDAAKREFLEETNLKITTDINYLASKKISRRKLVIMFYTNSDFDLSNCKSNTFELEFPRGSGNIQTYHEMDKYEWMDVDTARKKVMRSQLYFLDRLIDVLK